MKRNLTTIATVVMMVLSLSSFAKEKANPTKYFSSKAILENYIDASVLGNQKFTKEILANNFEFINATDNAKSSKKEYSKFLGETSNLKYNCDIKHEILDQTGKSAVAKATMKFDNFTRVDIINLVLTTDGWKINRVISNFL